jgi:hypothetical protein
MVALVHEGRPRLRLVSEDEACIRRHEELTMVRRRVLAVALVVTALVALGLALSRASGDGRLVGQGGLGGGHAAGASLPIAQRAYVVQPGDTLWEIARALQPEGDVRPLVYQLGKTRNGAPLRVGERITLP